MPRGQAGIERERLVRLHEMNVLVADLEMGGGVVRALRMARSDAAGGAGWRDLTGKLVFPGPVVLCRSGMPLAGRGGCPATTVGVPVARLSAPAARPGHAASFAGAAFAVDAVPIPLLRGLEPELEVLPEAVFGQGCAAFAVDDRILTEPGWDGDLVRVTGHCGATLVVLSDDARVMERSVGGLPLPLDGGRVVLAPSDAAGMRAALATALRSGEPGSGIAVAAPAHLLLAASAAAAEWWPAVRSGTVRMVSLGAEDGAADRQFLARLWRAGVAAGHIALEELAALLCWQPARLLGLPAKGRLHPGCDADLAMLDPEAPAPRSCTWALGALYGSLVHEQGWGVVWSGLLLQCVVDPVENRLVQSQVEVVDAVAGDDGGPVVLEESQFGFGEPSDHGVRRGIHVDRLAQVGIAEPFRVAVVKGSAGNAQLDRLLVGSRPPVGQLRVYGIRIVVEHPRQGSVDELRRHVQASGHQQITVSAIRAVQRQVARHQERSVGISHHHDALVLRLEVIDHAAQDFHAHVDLRLQVRKGQSRMPRGQAGIERERLVRLHEMNVLVAAVSQKGKEHLVGDLVRRAALLEDPHRVGVRIRHHLLYLEQLGDIVRQLRCPVAGIGNEGPATDCEHPGRERRDQAQPQIEPRPACDKLDACRTMHGLTAIIDGALAVLQSGSLAMVPIAGTGRFVDGRPRPGSDDAAAKMHARRVEI